MGPLRELLLVMKLMLLERTDTAGCHLSTVQALLSCRCPQPAPFHVDAVKHTHDCSLPLRH